MQKHEDLFWDGKYPHYTENWYLVIIAFLNRCMTQTATAGATCPPWTAEDVTCLWPCWTNVSMQWVAMTVSPTWRVWRSMTRALTPGSLSRLCTPDGEAQEWPLWGENCTPSEVIHLPAWAKPPAPFWKPLEKVSNLTWAKNKCY